MAKDILASDAQLPAHLRNRQAAMDEWGSGQSHGFPVLSIRGKVFHVLRGDDAELVTDPQTGEQATGIEIIVLKTHKGTAKTYYEKSYEEGDSEAPTCYSLDGIAPSADADDRQAKKCAICPHNQWGSRITDSGSKGKACSDTKRLAVAAAGTIDDPMLLRLPPMTLKPWDNYLKQLVRKGVNPNDVITRISFEASSSFPQLKFVATGFVTEEMAAEIRQCELDSGAVIDSITGSILNDRAETTNIPEPPEPDEDDEEEEEAPPPPPKPKPKAKAKPKAKPAPEPEPEEEEEDDDAADDELDDLDELDFDDIDFGDDDDD